MLQTSVHFSLDHGVLSGTDGAAAATVGGAAVGSAFVAGGAAVGGAVVGSTLIGAAAFLMLAAGGEAVENSCAAFNTYGEYNSVTFTVACYNPYNRPDDYKETLLIGADQIVMAEVTVYETMEPQTITVPLNGCEQLMFWLANTGDWSGQYIFYDIKLSKEYLEKDIPKAARLSQAIVTQPITSHKAVESVWERPKSSNQNNIDKFISGISTAYNEVEDLIDKTDPQYKIYTYYLETNAGQVCKAVSLKHVKTDYFRSMVDEHNKCVKYLEQLSALKRVLSDLSFSQVNANLSLPELGLGAITYGKIIKQGGKVLKECNLLVELMYDEKLAEAQFLEAILNNALDIDGKQSTENTVLCPLFDGETPPTDELQLVENFVIE